MEKTKNCPCPNTECARHGKCEECRKHHLENGGLPYCERDKEKSA